MKSLDALRHVKKPKTDPKAFMKTLYSKFSYLKSSFAGFVKAKSCDVSLQTNTPQEEEVRSKSSCRNDSVSYKTSADQ